MNYYEARAKERQRIVGGDRTKALPVNLPEAKGDARDLAGKAVGVSGKSVDLNGALKSSQGFVSLSIQWLRSAKVSRLSHKVAAKIDRR